MGTASHPLTTRHSESWFVFVRRCRHPQAHRASSLLCICLWPVGSTSSGQHIYAVLLTWRFMCVHRREFHPPASHALTHTSLQACVRLWRSTCRAASATSACPLVFSWSGPILMGCRHRLAGPAAAATGSATLRSSSFRIARHAILIWLRDVPVKANINSLLDIFSNPNTWYMTITLRHDLRPVLLASPPSKAAMPPVPQR